LRCGRLEVRSWIIM